MKHFQSKRGIDLNREGELRAHATYSPSPNEEKTGSRGPSQACDSGSSGGGTWKSIEQGAQEEELQERQRLSSPFLWQRLRMPFGDLKDSQRKPLGHPGRPNYLYIRQSFTPGTSGDTYNTLQSGTAHPCTEGTSKGAPNHRTTRAHYLHLGCTALASRKNRSG